ncbi:MAG: hypothetical protein ABJA87_03765 [bacterium]
MPLTALAVLRVVASIGSHRQLANLNDDLAGLDESSVRRVLTAIAHSAGWHEDGLAALVDGRF